MSIGYAPKDAKGNRLTNYKWLYCIPEYPTPLDHFNLRKVAFGYTFYGFSCHYPGIEPALVAISLGARVVEVHFCLSRNDIYNPDITSSVTPIELARLVEFAKQAPEILG